MKKVIAVLSLILVMITFTGCANSNPDEVLAANTVTFEVPLSTTKVCQFDIPGNLKIADTDAAVYWKFDDGSTIYRMSSTDSGKVSNYDSELDVYFTNKTVTKNFDDYSIVCSGTSEFIKTMKQSLGHCKVINREIKLPTDAEILSLPSYFKMEMQLTNDNLYMPKGEYKALLFSGYTACLYCNGYGEFIENCVMYKDWDEVLKPSLLNVITCNTDDHHIKEWYSDGTYFWAKSDKYFVAAKRITQNQYYCYTGTVGDMENFALQGLANIVYNK